MNIAYRTLLSGLLAMLLAACSATGDSAKAEKTVEEILTEKNLQVIEEIDQLINFNIRGWQYVDWENVILEDGPSKVYLVELNTPCRELQWAQRIAFTSFGRVVSRNDKIMVTDGSGHVRHCFMKTFYSLEKTPKA